MAHQGPWDQAPSLKKNKTKQNCFPRHKRPPLPGSLCETLKQLAPNRQTSSFTLPSVRLRGSLQLDGFLLDPARPPLSLEEPQFHYPKTWTVALIFAREVGSLLIGPERPQNYRTDPS